jgi:hypothetical protein
MFMLTGAGIGSLIEIYKASAFAAIEKKNEGDKTKTAAIATVKAVTSLILAVILTAWFLLCLMEALVFPGSEPKALYPIYFLLLFLWQLFVDMKGGIKALWKAFFNKEPKAAPIEEESEPKPRKQKVLVRKIRFTIDEDGNEVLLDE